MKLIILDRDGVINEDSDSYIKSPQEWRPIPGSLEAIALLNQKGYTVSVATNQSGIARSLYSVQTLELIHQKMHDAVQSLGGKIDSVFYCPHGPNDNCACRKPKPGLLQQIAAHYSLSSLAQVPVVGDSMRDLQAATAVEATPFLVLSGKGVQTQQKHMNELTVIHIFPDLLSFAQTLR